MIRHTRTGGRPGIFSKHAAGRLRFAFPGGVVAPGALGEIARTAHQFGAEEIRPGMSQELIVDLPDPRSVAGFRQTAAGQYLSRDGQEGGSPDRLIASVASAAYEATTAWLTESIYFDLLEACGDLSTGASVAICDPLQSLTPLFACDWNFLASEIRHHWHLAGYDERGQLQIAPYLLPSFLLPEVIRHAAGAPVARRIEAVRQRFVDSLLIASDIQLPVGPEAMAAYEGLLPRQNASETSRTYCLGIFRESLGFRPLFLDELSYLCRKHNVGRIYVTSLHSLFIKHIPAASVEEWRRLIARHGLNLRHDDASLYWQVAEGYEPVRERLVRALRASDAGTGGLSYCVGPDALRSGSVVAIVPRSGGLFTKRFAVYHREDFRRQSGQWREFASGLSLRELTRRVPAICQRYYNQFTLGPTYSHSAGQTHAQSQQAQADGAYSAPGTDTPVFECSACLTRYDARYGDARRAIAAGVPFESLPDDYECAVCAAPREAFRPLQSLYDNKATLAVAETMN